MTFQPTHVVPAGPGLPAWLTPDGSQPTVATLAAGTDVEIREWRGPWANIVCSNGWAGWVDGRRLVTTAGAPPVAPSVGGPRTTNGMAVAALVMGILFFFIITIPLALIFGYVGKNQIDQSGGTQDGRGMAIAGIVLGWVGVGLFVVGMIAYAIDPEAFDEETFRLFTTA